MPVMCCYKLVTAEFDYFGLKTKVLSLVHIPPREGDYLLLVEVDHFCRRLRLLTIPSITAWEVHFR